MDFSNTYIILATQGFQGICALGELFAIGFDINKIKVITFRSPYNNIFISFLKFNNMEYKVLKNSNEMNLYFNDIEADILLSLSFRYIFSDLCLSKIKKTAINFHPGLLPEYRGSFSTVWSLIKGEEFVGYTYHYIEKAIDKGNIIFREKIKIDPFDTAHKLFYLILQKGISRLKDVLSMAEKHSGIKQPRIGKFYKNHLPFNGIINNNWDEEMINRFIRAIYFPPFKPAKLIYKSKVYCISNYNEYRNIVKKQ